MKFCGNEDYGIRALSKVTIKTENRYDILGPTSEGSLGVPEDKEVNMHAEDGFNEDENGE